jgi:hypothetical protein
MLTALCSQILYEDYQVNYAPDKKMLQITSRIFIDDLNKALEKNTIEAFHIATEGKHLKKCLV